MVTKLAQFNCDEALQMKAVADAHPEGFDIPIQPLAVQSERRANAKSLLGVMSLESKTTWNCRLRLKAAMRLRLWKLSPGT